MEFWEASRLVVETHSGLNVSNSCARKRKHATLRVFAVSCGAWRTCRERGCCSVCRQKQPRERAAWCFIMRYREL